MNGSRLRYSNEASFRRHHHHHGHHGHYSRKASIGSATSRGEKRDPSNHYGRTAGTNPFEED